MAPDSEMKIEALKKAYAEIILNTSKEAACRVMAAERKALCFHHDLVSLKEESLAMFLRLKENFNSKITEAEAKSYSQEMKIEELEAQLSEAEGIIVDLRDELTQVQEEFDAMRRNQKQALCLHEAVQPAHEYVLQENTCNSSPLLISPVSNQNVQILHPINKCSHASSNELSSKSDLDQCHTGKYDITSIIMEDRETELYKNGSTQRIRAFERNLSNVNLCSLNEDNQPTVSVHPETKQEDSGNNSHYPMTDKMENGHQSECAYIEIVQKKNKKRGKSGDELNSDSGKSLKASSKSSADVSCSEANLKSVNITVREDPLSFFSSERDEKNVKVIPNASEGKLVRDCIRDKNQTIRSLRRSARKNSRYKEAIYCLKRPYRKKCTKPSQNSFSFHFVNPMEETEKGSENNDVCESVSDELGTRGEIKPDLCEEGSAVKYNVCNDTVLLDAQLFDVPISEGFGSTQSQTKNQSVNERHLKFTFYRKRRKNMLRKLDETIVIDKSTDNKEVERPTNIPVFGSCSLEDEMNATAHKLVSLSRKGC